MLLRPLWWMCRRKLLHTVSATPVILYTVIGRNNTNCLLVKLSEEAGRWKPEWRAAGRVWFLRKFPAHWRLTDSSLTAHWRLTDGPLTAHWRLTDGPLTAHWQLTDSSLTAHWRPTDSSLTAHWRLTDGSLTAHWRLTDSSDFCISNFHLPTIWLQQETVVAPVDSIPFCVSAGTRIKRGLSEEKVKLEAEPDSSEVLTFHLHRAELQWDQNEREVRCLCC